MPPRLFERLSAAFWGYISPAPTTTTKKTTVTRNARPSRHSPTDFVTPRRPEPDYVPLTPADTNTGSKRKRGPEVHNYVKRSKYEELQVELQNKLEDEALRREDKLLEQIARSKDDYDASDLFSAPIEYDSQDEYEEERLGDEDDGINYDYNIYNPTLRSDLPLPVQRPLVGDTLSGHVKVPGIVIESAEGTDSELDAINVLPPKTPPIYGVNDEDHIVFASTPASDDSAPDVDHTDGTPSSLLATPHKSDHSIYGSFLEEAADGEDTILLDSRARVGSLEDERVSKDQLLARGWPANTVSLIQRIHNRGREPVFASHWRYDFPMMPEGMFLPPGYEHAGYIYSSRRRDFRAKHAFERLMQLGPKVRDKITVGLAPEALIVKEIKRYMAWAEWDARNQFPDFPFVEIYQGTADEDVNDMQDTLLSRLASLHKHWAAAPTSPDAPKRPPPFIGTPRRDDDDDPPPLYGILVSHTLVGIVIFVPGAENSDSIGYLRTVGVFDFNVLGYDVWTSLALALLVMHVRGEATMRGCGKRREGVKERWTRQLSPRSDPDR